MDCSRGQRTWFRSVDQVQGYNSLKTPIWIFDVDRHRMWWGNESALTFWNAESLEDLLQRDYSSDSEVVRTRLRQIVDDRIGHDRVQESWTLFPLGKPVTVILDFVPILIEDGHDAVLIEASYPLDLKKDPEALRILEAARNTPLLVSTFSFKGALLAQNPAAAACYRRSAEPGLSPSSDLTNRFEDAEIVTRILASVRKDVRFQADTLARTFAGLRSHRVAARRGRDPISGEFVIVLTEEDISDHVELESRLGRVNEELEQRVHERTKSLVRLNEELSRQVREREEAEQALRDQFVLLQTLIDAMPAPVFYKDGNGRYLGCNEAFLDYAGTDREGIVGKSLHEVWPKNLADVCAAADAELFEKGSVQIYEGEIGHSDGKRRDAVFRKAPFYRGDGSIGGIVGVVIDVSERKRAEERLREAQRMEAIGRLTGGVAHDFNNLLTVVLGNLEIISLKISGNEQLQQCAQAAFRAVKRGADLTQQLLAYARQQPLSPRAVDVNSLVEEMTGLLERSLGETIAISTRLDSAIDHANADISQLQNAILNLCLNARDAMAKAGGQLTIETALRAVGAEAEGALGDLLPNDYVTICVSDTGCGMPPDIREHAVEPFFTTKDMSSGSGLGLSMVFGFAKQSGGTLTIESEPGRGTQVTLYLPRAGSHAEREEAASPAEPLPAGRETILVVEDDPDLRLYMETVLKRLGYSVVVAVNGADALAKLRESGHIDLLFSDVVLPGGMSGKDVADRALAMRPSIKVLFTSGYAEDRIGRDGQLDPGVELLPKPFTREALARRLHHMLRGQDSSAAE